MKIKICGIKTQDALNAAAAADFTGFVFYDKSPRNIAATQAASLNTKLKRVGLFVDPDDSYLDSIVKTARLDMIQLHGDETPARVAAIAARTKLLIIKAIRVASSDDVTTATSYEPVSDWLLFDAKVAGKKGGTGRTFDWQILKNLKSRKPWMLSGGLNVGNIAEALSVLKPDAVDVSSGVEDAPGIKNPAKIQEFIEALRASR